MSLRLTNELRLGSCHAEVLGRGWQRQPLAVADGSGSGAAALSAALQALRLTEAVDLPGIARLTVADEFAYHALLDGDLSRVAALAQARARFAAVLEREDLRVQVMPLAGGRRWLAAAVARSDLDAWRDALDQAGVRLAHLHTALLEDLRRLSQQIPEDDAVIALLREEGVSLLRVRRGLPIALAWERFDAGLPDSLEQRLRGFVRAAAAEARARMGRQCVIYLLPPSRALCRYVWDGNVLLAVRDHTNGLCQSFTRGFDLSGTPQGAGGAGGLLWVWDRSTINSQPSTHAACYDGNGNVMALVNLADGTTSAEYAYGPFAEPLQATGPMAKANPLRFSTQYADDVTRVTHYPFPIL